MRGKNLAEISDVIGTSLALRLARSLPRYGKNRQLWLYVPIRARPEHHITQIIGLDAATRLCWEFGGIQMTIGNPYRFEKQKPIPASTSRSSQMLLGLQ